MPGNRADEPEANGEKRPIRRRRTNRQSTAVDAVIAVICHPHADALGPDATMLRLCDRRGAK